ncbi:ABC transporter ATP-binding protein [Patescibacteria group bacterium]
MNIKVDKVSWKVDDQEIIKSISLDAKEGMLTGIIGPNGSGKSSLLRLIYRMHRPSSGSIYLNEHEISSLSHKETAKHLAVVTQERSENFDFSVYEMVKMGRNPHKNIMDPDTAEDNSIVYKALDRVGVSSFLNRDFYTLSGGEKQRVLIARALAQRAKALILDEPINHLDIRYQFEIMELLKSLNLTTIVTMHNLNFTISYCDYIYLLKNGQVVAEGEPQKILTTKLIKNVYDIDNKVDMKVSKGSLIVFSKCNKKTLK